MQSLLGVFASREIGSSTCWATLTLEGPARYYRAWRSGLDLLQAYGKVSKVVSNVIELEFTSHCLCKTYVSLSEKSSPSSGQFLCEPMMSSLATSISLWIALVCTYALEGSYSPPGARKYGVIHP